MLSGRNRRIRQVSLPLAGGLFRCRYCGYAITGEEIKKEQKDGTVKNHVYCRCSNHVQPKDHPSIRWRASDLEQAIVDQLNALRLPTPDKYEEVVQLPNKGVVASTSPAFADGKVFVRMPNAIACYDLTAPAK